MTCINDNSNIYSINYSNNENQIIKYLPITVSLTLVVAFLPITKGDSLETVTRQVYTPVFDTFRLYSWSNEDCDKLSGDSVAV